MLALVLKAPKKHQYVIFHEIKYVGFHLPIGEQYPSSGLRPSEGIAHQFLGMMTAFTDTSSPELPYSLIVSKWIFQQYRSVHYVFPDLLGTLY